MGVNDFNPSDWDFEDGVLKMKRAQSSIEYFSLRRKLRSISIPPFITAIGGSCFSMCENLQYVEIPDSVKSIGGHAFSGCKSLESVRIPNSVETIGEKAFFRCESLQDVALSDGVQSIGANAFEYCAFKEIYIPASVTSLEPTSFGTSMLDVTLDAGNTSYKLIDGNLYSYDGKTLIRCYALNNWGMNEKIPQGVEEIGRFAFISCGQLISLEIPDSVVKIGGCAFAFCDNLKSVTIPKNVISIGYSAFGSCKSLRSVIFEDTANWTFDKKDKHVPVKEKILQDSVKARDFLASDKGKGKEGMAKLS